MLAREESRIFEELLSRFDSLGDEQMLAVGVTPDWSAKDLLAHLANRLSVPTSGRKVRPQGELEKERLPSEQTYSEQTHCF
jgi:hypothetical protein